jgi:23S rRNA pseudouridine1911/1915/1917 synthase
MDQFSILYEDQEILIANKLGPLPVQPEKSGDPSLQDLLRARIAERDGVPPDTAFLEAAHRIDRRASGAIVFAKTSKSLSTLEAAFRDRRVAKDYIACVEREPIPPAGKLENRLIWDKRRNVVRALPAEKDAPSLGVLEYSLEGRSERYFFIQVRLVTGKHHQIRAQLSAAGWPIRGDLKYGARRSAPNGLIMLHARRLALIQPRTGERLEIEAPFPSTEPLWTAFAPAVEGD